MTCGCVNEIHESSGIQRSVKKCQAHATQISTPESRGLDYYKRDGAGLDESGVPLFDRYVEELRRGLSEEDYKYLCTGLGKLFIEFGAGLGQYIPLILSGGGRYIAVEDSDFACRWIRGTFYRPVYQQDVETLSDTLTCDCIIAVHILEHVKDAPALLKKMHKMVRERIYLIVPDDSDPMNPDHLWFFSKETLHVALKRAGFKNLRIATQQIVPQEKFFYVVAEK